MQIIPGPHRILNKKSETGKNHSLFLFARFNVIYFTESAQSHLNDSGDNSDAAAAFASKLYMRTAILPGKNRSQPTKISVF